MEAVIGSTHSFEPLSQIHQNLSGFHCYADDRTRAVLAHHYCSCVVDAPGGRVRQCLIYDSNSVGAKLIGIEYVVDSEVFQSLPADEKKYWHSHKYEVESGMLVATLKTGVPGIMDDVAERPIMKELQCTYGKTIHTWQVDRDSLPLGPPSLMMAFTGDGQLSPDAILTRDTAEGIDTAHKRQLRKSYLDTSYKVLPGADNWESTGQGVVFRAHDVSMKQGLAVAHHVEDTGKNGSSSKATRNSGNSHA